MVAGIVLGREILAGFKRNRPVLRSETPNKPYNKVEVKIVRAQLLQSAVQVGLDQLDTVRVVPKLQSARSDDAHLGRQENLLAVDV